MKLISKNFFVFKVVTEEVVLIPGGYSDSRGGPISEVQLYSPNGECQLQVNKRK